MAAPQRHPSLPSLLLAPVRRHGEEPALFHHGASGWRWRSWLQLADQVARGALALEECGAAPLLTFTPCFSADDLAVDLAVQAAGRTSAPRAPEAPERGAARVAVAGSATAEGVAVLLPAVRSRLERWRPAALDPLAGEVAARGAVEVVTAAGPRALGGAALRRAAEAVGSLVGPLAGRPIVALGVGLEAPAGRLAAAWGLAAGAALVLPPGPAELVPTVLWARPTVVVAAAQEVELLAAACEGRRLRRWSRLAAVLVAGATDAAGEGAERLARRGVRLSVLPSLADLLDHHLPRR